MILADELYELSKAQKKEVILGELDAAGDFDDELDKAFALSNILNTFIDTYIDIKISKCSQWGYDNRIMLLIQKVDEFLPIAKGAITSAYDEAQNMKGNTNIYDFFEAKKLTFSNKVIRSLNAKMGLFWERIASVSPYAVNPEEEFGIKIKGIDLIIKNSNNNRIEYVQLKTQRNTLTGSQAPRSKKELSIHEHPVFATAFSLSTWTFPVTPGIERVSGADFWSKIDIEYDLVCGNAKNLIEQCELEYLRLLSES
ncbi:TPA: hypothetical protein ACN305_004921 [Vibrio campbellii]|nr:hypothetical protein [Vibrio campbellii]